MITAAQMRAGRALLGIDQQTLADLAGVSLPTIQRMEASEGNVRGVVDTLTKVVTAFDRAGVELIAEGAPSAGRGTRCTLQVRSHEQDQRKRISFKTQEGPRHTRPSDVDGDFATATATAD